MRLVERSEVPEDHYTEGELDLEAPEELALGEVDDEQLLEEELDNEDIAEEEVDEDTLELTLEHLVHQGDSDGVEASVEGRPMPVVAGGDPGANDPDDPDDLDDLEVSDLEDLEESLDSILAERLAGDEDARPDEPEEDGANPSPARHAVAFEIEVQLGGGDGLGVAPCQADEFVCVRCFLVRKRAQLAGPAVEVCRDCSS